MMQIAAHDLRSTFQRGVNEEAYRRLQWQHREQQDRERRQRQNEVDQSESDLLDMAAVVITVEQAEIFQSEIDTYQLATVEALEENRKALDRVRERLDSYMERAHRLEDGRRVFKTESGLQVFDEYGVELSADVISPDEIPDHLPRWEQVEEALNELERLEAEQAELLEYQADLDEAQELLDGGEMTQEQFDNLREQIAVDAPDAVKSRISGTDVSLESSLPTATLSSDIDLDAQLAAMPIAKPLVPGGSG